MHYCRRRAAGALKFANFKVVRDQEKCIGCGECILKCPSAAWTRNINKRFMLVIMGRTGKKDPRIAQPFISWVDEASIIKILKKHLRIYGPVYPMTKPL